MLKLVIPKGSLEEQTLRLFEAADLRVRRGSDRDYHGTVDDDRIERVSILRPQEIPLYVQDGLFDLGITGQDWIAETEADVEVRDDALLRSLGNRSRHPGGARRAERASREQREGDPAGHPDLHRVPETHRAVLRRPRDPREGRLVLRRDGGEGPRDRRRDRRHHRDGQHAPRPRDEDHRDAPHLRTGPDREPRGDASTRPKRAAIEDIQTLLLGALRAEGRVLIKLNVSEDRLQPVLAVVPSMKAPTVSPLSEGGFAIEAVVDKRGVNRLIPDLKAAGATDILEMPISKIVP